MSYAVKELFYTLQGEGAQTGRAAVFCRFAGCNLWTGREEDRADAVCTFCDTDFVGTDGPGGGKFATPDALADAVMAAWPRGAGGAPYVVCTGGEPLLQLDAALVDALHRRGIEVAVETNGTQAPPPGLDWICVSPKAAAPVVLTAGNELKLVYPQPLAMPERFEAVAGWKQASTVGVSRWKAPIAKKSEREKKRGDGFFGRRFNGRSTTWAVSKCAARTPISFPARGSPAS